MAEEVRAQHKDIPSAIWYTLCTPISLLPPSAEYTNFKQFDSVASS